MNATVDSLLSSSTASSTASTKTAKKSDNLGKEDFLSLYVTQMKNQDPLDPQDNSEALSQLAQYSELEAMLDVKESTASLTTAVTTAIPELTTSVQYSSGIFLIGSEVRIAQDTATWYGDTNEPADINVNMGNEKTADVDIVSSDGTVIKTITATADDTGTAKITWDGTDENGNFVDVGVYQIQIDGSDTNDSLYSYKSGVVEGVSSKNNSAMVRIDGELYPMSKLIDVGS
jgi:flagellar basal-body rod modification protein FlgD